MGQLFEIVKAPKQGMALIFTAERCQLLLPSQTKTAPGGNYKTLTIPLELWEVFVIQRIKEKMDERGYGAIRNIFSRGFCAEDYSKFKEKLWTELTSVFPKGSRVCKDVVFLFKIIEKARTERAKFHVHT